MDRIINSNTEKQSIYEIYRACRLCGAGAGYKMPIIQNVVDLDTSGIELRQKIRDCVQIEVHPEDKMPPLICELCVDKVNDFYEFMELCQRTNKRTRMRLGLPPQTLARIANSDVSSNSGDCILGVTEPVYQNDDSDEPLAPITRRQKQNEVKIKKENAREKRPPSPPRGARASRTCHEDSMALSSLKKENVKDKRPPDSRRESRNSKSCNEDTMSLSSLKKDNARDKRPSTPPRGSRNSKNYNEESISLSSLKKDNARDKRPSPPPRGSRNSKSYREDSESPSYLKKDNARDKRPCTPPRGSRNLKSYREDSVSPSYLKNDNVRNKRPSSPLRGSRNSNICREDFMSLSSLKQQVKKSSSKNSSPPQPKSILKKDKAKEKTVSKREESPEDERPTRSKRPREPPKPEVPQKRVKLSVSPKLPHRSSRRASPPPPTPPPPEYPCRICGQVHRTSQALASHLRSHTVLCTSPKMACDACQEWFPSAEAAQAHHKRHRDRRRPYRCKRCSGRYNTQAGYDEHIASSQCLPWPEVPDVQCAVCWQTFPTSSLLNQHCCGGEGSRPGGKCNNCKRTYTLLKNLKKHEATCLPKKKADTVKIPPSIRSRLKPAQVRVARCDALLTRVKQEHYDVSDVAQNFGLDRRCTYPYLTSYINSDLQLDGMVKIKSELELDYEDEEFVHWDSDSDRDDPSTVNSLITLALKTLFSKKCLGKVPRKKRKVKTEKSMFDMLNASEFEDSMSRNIDNIIENLGNEWNRSDVEENGSDEESLLTNYVMFDEPAASNNKSNDDNSNDSQSLFGAVSVSVAKVSFSNNDENIEKSLNANEKESEREKDVSRSSGASNDDRIAEKRASDSVDDIRIESKDSNISSENRFDSDRKKGSTNNDKLNDNSVNSTKSDEVVVNKGSENDSQASNNVNINKEDNLIANKEIVPNNDSENPINDNENRNDYNERNNDASSAKLTNGEVEEKSDKLSFGDMNDISDTEMDDTKLMDALNEHIGENSKSNDDVNNDSFTKNSDSFAENNDTDSQNNDDCVTNEGNGAKDLSNVSIENNENSNDHVNDINDMIDASNDGVTDNNDKIAENNDINNGVVSENNDEVEKSNDYETEKISLEDLLPPKSVTKSMDLDSISDEDFDFDAC